MRYTNDAGWRAFAHPIFVPKPKTGKTAVALACARRYVRLRVRKSAGRRKLYAIQKALEQSRLTTAAKAALNTPTRFFRTGPSALVAVVSSPKRPCDRPKPWPPHLNVPSTTFRSIHVVRPLDRLNITP